MDLLDPVPSEEDSTFLDGIHKMPVAEDQDGSSSSPFTGFGDDPFLSSTLQPLPSVPYQQSDYDSPDVPEHNFFSDDVISTLHTQTPGSSQVHSGIPPSLMDSPSQNISSPADRSTFMSSLRPNGPFNIQHLLALLPPRILDFLLQHRR